MSTLQQDIEYVDAVVRKMNDETTAFLARPAHLSTDEEIRNSENPATFSLLCHELIHAKIGSDLYAYIYHKVRLCDRRFANRLYKRDRNFHKRFEECGAPPPSAVEDRNSTRLHSINLHKNYMATLFDQWKYRSAPSAARHSNM